MSRFFIFTPKLGEGSHFDEYFSNGLKSPTSIYKPGKYALLFGFDSFFLGGRKLGAKKIDVESTS